MNIETPFVVLYSITAVGVIVWLCGLQFVINTMRRNSAADEPKDDMNDVSVASGEAVLSGSTEVAGRAAELAAKAATGLALQNAVPFGPVRILEKNDRQVVFETVPQPGGLLIRRGLLQFEPISAERTRIDYAVALPRRNGFLVGACIFLLLGLIALIVGFDVIYLWVAPESTTGGSLAIFSDDADLPFPLAAIPLRRPLSQDANPGKDHDGHPDSQFAVSVELTREYRGTMAMMSSATMQSRARK